MIMALSIAAGGAVGALLRHFINSGAVSLFGHGFPWGTMIVNILGSFIMGLFISIFAHIWQPSQEIRAFLTVGLLGAMTTFSTFSLDTVILFERGDYALMAIYSGVSIFLSVAALFSGLIIVRHLVA